MSPLSENVFPFGTPTCYFCFCSNAGSNHAAATAAVTAAVVANSFRSFTTGRQQKRHKSSSDIYTEELFLRFCGSLCALRVSDGQCPIVWSSEVKPVVLQMVKSLIKEAFVMDNIFLRVETHDFKKGEALRFFWKHDASKINLVLQRRSLQNGSIHILLYLDEARLNTRTHLHRLARPSAVYHSASQIFVPQQVWLAVWELHFCYYGPALVSVNSAEAYICVKFKSFQSLSMSQRTGQMGVHWAVI